MKKSKKNDIITFKIDEALKECMSGIENRSEFIRKAILNSCVCQCPLCKGTGRMTKAVEEKWAEIKIILDYYMQNDKKNVDIKLQKDAPERQAFREIVRE